MTITKLPMILIIVLLLPVHTLFARWETVFFTDAGGVFSASSELEKPENPMDIGRYSPVNLFDDDPASAWVEGDEGPGIGSFVMIGRQNPVEKYLLVNNGYQESEQLYYKNNRVKDFSVTLYTAFTSEMRSGQFGFEASLVQFGEPILFTLKDEMGTQQFELPFNPSEAASFMDAGLSEYKKTHPEELNIEAFSVIRLEIVSVYKGSRWDDTCIAEISFNNTGIMGQITDVRISRDGQRVFLQTSEDRTLLLVDAQTSSEESGEPVDGEARTFTLIDVDPSMQWAIIGEQDGFAGGGRVEETFHLWSLTRMKKVPPALMRAYKAKPLKFTTRSGRLYLETFEENHVLLEDINLDLESGNW